MRASIFQGTSESLILAHDVHIDLPRPGEVRVQVTHCGVCHSDLHVVDGDFALPSPTILGHEVAGVVEAVGGGVSSLVEGDRVVVSLQSPCGRCSSCKTGRVHLCVNDNGTATGTMRDGGTRLAWNGNVVYRGFGLGGFAEMVVVNARSAVKIDDDVPLELACLLGCAVQTGVGAVFNLARVQPGDTVMVIGLGGVGVAAVQGARIAGASRIFGVDTIKARLTASVRFGVTDELEPQACDLATLVFDATAGVGIDHAIVSAATPSAVAQALTAVRPGGSVTIVGVPGFDDRVELPLISWALSEKRLSGSYMGSSDPQSELPRLVALWRAGLLDLSGMVTNVRPLEELPDALADMRTGAGLRTVMDVRAPSR